jgi:hypothetical protein
MHGEIVCGGSRNENDEHVCAAPESKNHSLLQNNEFMSDLSSSELSFAIENIFIPLELINFLKEKEKSVMRCQ